MSNDLETVVRPSQTLDYAPAKVYYSAGQIGVPNITLRFGRGSGQGKIMPGSFSANSSNYCTQYVNEQSSADFGRAF